jgi:hypothetical protein
LERAIAAREPDREAMAMKDQRALLVIAAALVLGIANQARAEIIYFSCQGTLETHDVNLKLIEREPWTESLTFDTDKRTVKPASDDPLPVEVNDDSLEMPLGTRGPSIWFHPTTRDHQQVISAPQRAANFSSPDERHNLRDRASVPGRRSRWRLFTIPCNRRASLDVR